ncbi:PAS domain-containing protein [Methylomonas sp. MED-D]|uniref:PAS domain-containing protein n=1 Tax=unclassified Methylomonas TaxID=2608980 RepID=UPI0028A4235F|nr:PAS domain-containing protein [Methylomonas sp. MV1]MDT4330918.1 PAS domain-containing protein [Methylomonas sp. MV1]
MQEPSANNANPISRLALIVVCLLLLGNIALTFLHHLRTPHELPVFGTDVALPGLAILLLLILMLKDDRRRGISTGYDIQDASSQTLIVVDTHCIIRSVNKTAATTVNLPVEELIDLPVHELFHPAQFSENACPICQHIRAGQEMPATDFRYANGHWQEISLTRLPRPAYPRLLQIQTDISSRKQVEEQLALVIDGAELGYWDWDYLTGKHSVNQRWLDMLGLRAADLDHYISDWANRLHPDDRERVHRIISQHIESGEPYVIEFRMQHRQGHWVWIQGAGAVVARDPATGKPTRLCGTHQNISARKQSESSLQAAYQIISHSAAVVMKWNNAEGMPIEFATENARQLFGYSAEQLATGDIFYMNLIHPDDLDGYIREISSCGNDANCREVVHQPYRIIAKNGGVKWVQDRKVLTRDEFGRVVDYQGLVTDVTQQRQQSSAIRNIITSSAQHAGGSMLDNLALLALETLGADYALIAEQWELGRARSLSLCAKGQIVENLELDPRDFPSPDLQNGTRCCYTQAVADRFPKSEWLRDRGIVGYLAIPLLDNQQHGFGFVAVAYCRPIPDVNPASDILTLFAVQISAELERSRAIAALKDQKQRLMDAQALSHIGDWCWHLQDQHFSWSDEMYRITGTGKTGFIPNYANLCEQLVHPDDLNLFKTAMEHPEAENGIDFRHRIVLGDGQIRHVHQRGKPILAPDGRCIAIQGTMQDITDRLQTEQRLLEAKHQAEQATKVKSEFLANMSHEIRTPMNAIIGLVELCLNSAVTAKQRDYLERVETAARSLMTIIDDILDFSKMEAGKMHLESLPFLLEEMLDQVFSTMSELSARKGVDLIRPNLQGASYAVIGDPQRLRQIFINLIGNAIKFTDFGEVRVTLTEISRSTQHVCLQFSIVDTGIGMSQELQSKLFQAFSQGDSSVTRHYGGTGLGLIISKQLVEQMGGSISVSSQENLGSTFTFTVNLGVTNLASIRLAQHQQQNPVDTSKLQYIRGARILLVEDNEVNRIVAIELLEQAHLCVDIAEHGEIALAKLRGQSYDCVLMDIQMPVLDGYETTRQLRKLSGCQTLPVIAMTANAMSDDRNKCLQADMDDFISKPILPETLYAMLVKWIPPRHDESAESPTASAEALIPYLYGIDSATGLLHTAGNHAVYRKVLQKFAENHADTMLEIAHAFSSNDYDKAYQLVHTLKGLVGSLGALQLQSQLVRLEESLKDHKLDIAHVPNIDSNIATITLEMAKLVNSIKITLPQETSMEIAPLPLSSLETRQQLAILINKLQVFDSDADQQLDHILAHIDDRNLISALLPIKKQIANYQFIDAAQAINHLLDHGI